MLLIKVGGGKTINWDYLAEDLVWLSKKEKIIVVHGAGSVRDEIANKLNYPTKTIVSPSGITSVYTDKKAIEIFLMVYAGLVNKQIVAKLQKYGLNAIGLSGVDAKLWLARRKRDLYAKDGSKIKLIKDSFTGRVESVNISLIELLLKHNYLPVLCPPAIDEQSDIVNTDNDWASAVLAGMLNVKKMIVLFEAPGLLKDVKNERSLIKRISKIDLEKMLQFAKGRMKKKVLGAKKALSLGVKTIYWSDGRVRHPVKNALRGKGTIIT